MAIEQLISGLDAHLTDEHVLAAVQEFLTAIEYQLEYDGETIVFSPDMKIHILSKSLVLERGRRDDAYLTARAVFDPLDDDGKVSVISYGGTLKIIFNLAGEYIDEVYSRDSVVARD